MIRSKPYLEKSETRRYQQQNLFSFPFPPARGLLCKDQGIRTLFFMKFYRLFSSSIKKLSEVLPCGSPEYYQAVIVENEVRNMKNEVQNMKNEVQNMKKSKNGEVQLLKSNLKIYEVIVGDLNEKIGNLNGKIKEFEAIITVLNCRGLICKYSGLMRLYRNRQRNVIELEFQEKSTASLENDDVFKFQADSVDHRTLRNEIIV